MVWRASSGICNFQHFSKEAAENEARRLANSCPGERFFVIKTVTAFEANVCPAQRVTFGPATDDGIPF